MAVDDATLYGLIKQKLKLPEDLSETERSAVVDAVRSTLDMKEDEVALLLGDLKALASDVNGIKRLKYVLGLLVLFSFYRKVMWEFGEALEEVVPAVQIQRRKIRDLRDAIASQDREIAWRDRFVGALLDYIRGLSRG